MNPPEKPTGENKSDIRDVETPSTNTAARLKQLVDTLIEHTNPDYVKLIPANRGSSAQA